MAHLHYASEGDERQRNGIYVSRCAALSVALLNVFLLATCLSLLLILRGTSVEVEVHRVRRQVDGSSTAPIADASTRLRRFTPLPTSAASVTGSSWWPSWSTTMSYNRTQPNPDDAIDNLHLPTYIRPYHYDVHWRPDIYHSSPDQFTLNGTAEIYMRCHSPSSVIWVNYRHLAFDTFSMTVVSLRNNSAITLTSICGDRLNEGYYLTMDRPLAVGEEVVVTMRFTAYIQNGPQGDPVSNVGAFRSQYSIGNDTRYALFTQMEPTDARRTFPCVDDPSVKATFTISIDRTTQMLALSNTPLNYTIIGNGSWVTDVFETTKPMSTYLVAFAIFDYTNVTVYSAGNNPVKIGLWAQSDLVSDGYLNFTSIIAPVVVNFYAEYFNYSFNWPKLDLVSIPGKNFNAMENWGLSFFQSNFILFDYYRSDVVERANLVTVVSQIIFYNWIGNTVTFDWWDDEWLTQAMGYYFQYIAMRRLEPTLDTDQLFIYQSFYSNGMYVEDAGVSPPVYHSNFKTFADLGNDYNDVTLNKGACLIRMLSKIVGDDVFRMALQHYLREYEYDNVDHNDLFMNMEEAYMMKYPGVVMDFNVTEVMLTWIMQKGYPLVTVSRSQNDSSNQLMLSQNIYLFHQNYTVSDLGPSPYWYLWEIPVDLVTSYNNWNPLIVWMHKEQQIGVQLNQSLTVNDWVLVNYNLSGYYRVNYDDVNWMALTAQLTRDYTKIPVINRAQLIDDSFTLPLTGHLSATVGLRLANYLSNETETLPWEVFFQNFAKLLGRLSSNTQLCAQLQKYAVQLLQWNYNYLGWDDKANDSLSTTIFRGIILHISCLLNVDNCISQALDRFQQLKTNGFDDYMRVTPNQRLTVYRAAASNGSYDDWKMLLMGYQATLVNFTSESDKLAEALTYTANTTAIASLLQAIQNKQTIAPQHYNKILSLIALSPQGYNASWDYLTKYGLNATGRVTILQAFSLVISTPEELSRLNSYFSQYPPATDMEAGTFVWIQQAIQQNIIWRQKYEQSIANYLTSLNL